MIVHVNPASLLMTVRLSVPASFINVDLEIEASFDLTLIAHGMGDKVFVLFCGEEDGRFRLCAEPLINNALSDDQAACTEWLLSALEALPDAAKTLLPACTRRVLDYGFEGGVEEIPFTCDVSPAHLGRMVTLDLSMRISVYPFREPDPSLMVE